MVKKYKITINNNGLNERDKETVLYALKSKSALDALNRSNFLLKKHKEREIRLSYFAKLFLKGLAISAEFDLSNT